MPAPEIIDSAELAELLPDSRPGSDRPDPVPDLRATGEALLGSFSAVLRKLSDGTLREKTVLSKVTLDRTTVGRVVRAVRSDDPLLFIHLAPSPEGLRNFLEAAGTLVSAKALRDARRSVDAYERVLDSLPGGKVALNAAIASWRPEASEHAVSTSRQSIFRAMSSVTGFEAAGSCAAMFLRPGDDPERCDAMHVMGRFGLRRLRDGAMIGLFGYAAFPDGTGPASVEPVPPPTDARRPWDYLLPEHCRGAARLEAIRQSPSELLVALPGSSPAPLQSVNIAFAQLVRGQIRRGQDRPGELSWYQALPRVPTQHCVVDLFFHESAYSGHAPILTAKLAGGASPIEQPLLDGRLRDRERSLDAVDPGATVEPIGMGLGRTATPIYGRYPEMLESCLRHRGWNPSEFAGFRMQIKHPIPMVGLTLWFDLLKAGARRG